ncbi:histidine phosphatase family protein [Paenarthrobacter sp. NPDC091669]|uniref:histidine phosphatase family protein n=1 Tax=Paenarthrobacter sp. NPDC091669 TaxID=3364384 RepID=UPI00381A5E30
MSDQSPDPMPQRLLLLRHGQVSSHRGDVPVTPDGLVFAETVGLRLAEQNEEMLVLSGETRRTCETAEAVAEGARRGGMKVDGPRISFGLRNPDLYVAGERVNMVSSAEALAAQVEGLGEDSAARVPFFTGFLPAKDRIGWWLSHPDPPGDNASSVAHRIAKFAQSLSDQPLTRLVVGVTHSPVLRACGLKMLGQDRGEPDWVAGLSIEIGPDRTIKADWFEHPA